MIDKKDFFNIITLIFFQRHLIVLKPLYSEGMWCDSPSVGRLINITFVLCSDKKYCYDKTIQ